jgi:site-specific DNA-methyltransferase (adenine-specific)
LQCGCGLLLHGREPAADAIFRRRHHEAGDEVIPWLRRFKRELEDLVFEALILVKSGKVKSGDIRDLRGTLERRESAIGVFITLETPSPQMETEAISAGYYESSLWGQKFRKLQILTIEDLLRGQGVEMPPQHGTFKQAQRVKEQDAQQLGLNLPD